MTLSFPCHPRDFRTWRGGSGGAFTVPAGKRFVVTAIGSDKQNPAPSPLGLLAPLCDLYADGVLVLRGGALGYISSAALALQEFYGPMIGWTPVPEGLQFPAGTVLQVRQVMTPYPPPYIWTTRLAGYLLPA